MTAFEPIGSADSDIVPLLIGISKSMRALHGIKLAKLGFHNGQDELLLAADARGITISAIADQLSIRPSTVSKMMDRLVARGMVERIGDVRDARRTLVRITPAGLKARSQLLEARRELEEEFVRAFGRDQCPAIAASLAECQVHLTNRLNRLR